MTRKSILWKRLDAPGHDVARLWFQDPFWCLEGTSIFIEDRQICRLDYQVSCDKAWNTVSGKVFGWVGEKSIDVQFAAAPDGHWMLNGCDSEEVKGCTDIDLNFTPATNLLPIRRLQLPIGQKARVRSAWLKFPSFTLEILEQTYHHVGPGTYRYETFDGKFVKDLTVDEDGFVTHYPGLWAAEAESF